MEKTLLYDAFMQYSMNKTCIMNFSFVPHLLKLMDSTGMLVTFRHVCCVPVNAGMTVVALSLIELSQFKIKASDWQEMHV